MNIVPCFFRTSVRVLEGLARPFKFFSAWVDYPDFQQTVASTWEEISSLGDAMHVLRSKLKHLRYRFRIWNREQFGLVWFMRGLTRLNSNWMILKKILTYMVLQWLAFKLRRVPKKPTSMLSEMRRPSGAISRV